MRAVLRTAPGGPENLTIGEIEEPIAGLGEVRVRVRAAGLNRADLLQRMGRYPAPPGIRSDVLGLEFAGEVEQLGPASGLFQEGDRVMGVCGGAAQADLVVSHERMLLPIPSQLGFEEAACIPEAFLTAHDALFSQAHLMAGERLLIHAVGSGVGTAALQLARATGALTLGTSRQSGKLARARELGLDQPILVEKEGGFAAPVLAATQGKGVEVIADLIGGTYLAQNVAALAYRGRMICIGTLGGVRAELDLGAVLRKRLRLTGTMLRGRSLEEKIAATQAFASSGLRLFEASRLRPILDRVYPLGEIRRAHERMASEAGFGKIVLSF